MPSVDFTGVGWHSWTVPAATYLVNIELMGAGNGNSHGGRVIGGIEVDPGQVLWMHLGQSGRPASGNNNGAGAEGGGGPGGQGYGRDGGDGGAGCSLIRRGSKSGTLLAVAGGAGGKAGSGARGGHGGAGQGEAGREDFDSAIVVPPTGGSQANPGARGRNLNNSNFDGVRGQDAKLGVGGRGGSHNNGFSYGGGGGGGGYYPGGGGTASGASGPSTGGSGGSNYIGKLSNGFSYRGEGRTGNGTATLSWTTSTSLEQRPNTPSDVTIDGEPESPEFATGSQTGPVVVEARVTDPNSTDILQIALHLSTNKSMLPATVYMSPAVSSGERTAVTLTGLAPNTHYYGRLYGYEKDAKALAQSLGYNSIDFWTNRPPLEPELVAPSENATVSGDLVTFPLVFDWKHVDPDDEDDVSSGWEWHIRRAATSTVPASPWFLTLSGTTGTTFTLTEALASGLLVDGVIYDWEVRTADSQGLWGPWALPRSFYVLGATNPPSLIFPTKGEAISTEEDNKFQWRFTDPTPGQTQINADLRYRLVGQDDDAWIMLFGQEVGDPPGNSTDANGNPTTGIPGNTEWWTIEAFTLDAGYAYEWQVRTTDSNRDQSAWSLSAIFWTTPLSEVVDLPDTAGPPQGSLGCGEYRVFVYQQGGSVMVGEVTPLVRLTWNRKRDDISNCIIYTNGFDYDCGQLLGGVHCWLNELVVFRDGVRVWEGPITRIGYSVGSVEIEAQDVLAYVYRRIMRQGYDDSYRLVNGVQFGLTTVVERARRIIMNALAPADPNVLPYLSAISLPGDAKQSRVIPDYAKTAWEEIDDLAATAGLDYVAIGRRILLWDVHRPLGRLPELRDKDFSDPPIVTEYGMQLANYYAVTNNTGVWGAVTQDAGFDPYGPIEMLASAYGETTTETGALTRAGHDQLVRTLEGQASRGFADRWPTPVVVRVPDNAQVSPDAPVTLAQLVPGTWLPVYATGTVRHLGQWQKLDAVVVEVTQDGEAVRVTMSPAPNAGQDPDTIPPDVVVEEPPAPGMQVFTANGTFTPPARVTSVDVLLVAGGGGGGSTNSNNGNGGGGGGGVRWVTGIAVTPGVDVSVVVGNGGNGATAGSSTSGQDGGNSSFGSELALGGGGGFGGIWGSNVAPAGEGRPGGSGGGGGTSNDTAYIAAGGVGASGQGNSGGGGHGQVTIGGRIGGGGGGAGTSARNGSGTPVARTAEGLLGGNGLDVSSYVGTSVGVSGVVGGGGGAGGHTTAGTGGSGGGGNGGGANLISGAGRPGTVNTGGGGGGAQQGNAGGNGGSGVVVVKWGS